MLENLIRMVAAGAVYLASTFAVLAAVLSIWSSYHLSLRSVGHPIFVFFLISVCLGLPAFWVATTFVQRRLVRREGITFHFMSTAALYLYVGFVVAVALVHPPRESLEGGQIAFGLSAVVGVLAIMVNVLWMRRNGASPTSRSTRSRAKMCAPG